MSTEQIPEQSTGRVTSGRHQINIGHLVMGLAFLGIIGVWALIQGDLVEGADIRWLLPVPWVVAGIAGLLATTLSGPNQPNQPSQPIERDTYLSEEIR